MFNLAYNNDEQVLSSYLIRDPLPNLIIKIIGRNDQEAGSASRASIQNAFQHAMLTLMEQTSELLLCLF